MSIRMTIDGTTNEVTSLELRGADGTTKTATLSEVFSGSVNITSNGTYNVEGKQTAVVNVAGGGSSPTGLVNFHKEEVTLTETVTYNASGTITHNAGFVPDIIIIRFNNIGTMSGENIEYSLHHVIYTKANTGLVNNTSQPGVYAKVLYTVFENTENSIKLQVTNNSYRMFAGMVYDVYCIKLDNEL